MQSDTSVDISVAPLRIRKLGDTRHPRQHAEPPIDPPTRPPRFHNYLRAAYPFQPTSSPSPSTVTLPLNSGDILLIHSIHTNGWADGTLLETGERGWLPTNYCEAYDYAAMRPLLRALTEFWDIMRSNNATGSAIFQNKDYMRGLVAGVRYLLEKCDCLTRESANVRKHDGIRRMRKGLLSDLSLLVKSGKQLQTLSPESEALIDTYLDDLLLQAFKIVTRAVKFFDIWGEEIAFSRSLSGLDDLGAESTRLASPSPLSQLSSAAINRRSYLANQSLQQSPRPQSKRNSTTHRLSYASKAERLHLASDRLNKSYDAFLGVLASFLGSHMQSRSSSELLLTTQQAVKSCRQLLSIVELVIERNPDSSETLNQSKDSMYDAITELVLSAKQVFLPLHNQDDELVYRPDENRRLVHAATNCVSGAGRCVARTRSVLEEAGDFELDPSLLDRASSESSKQQSPTRSTFPASGTVQGLQIAGVTADIDSAQAQQTLPWLNIPGEEEQARGDSPSTINSSVPPTPADEQLVVPMMPSSSSQTTLHSPIQHDRPLSNEFAIPVGHLRHKSLIRSMKTSSKSASESSQNTNEHSDMSTATTAVMSSQASSLGPFSSQESLVKSNAPEDEAEAVLLEKTYAHELMYNRDGQLVGGTLHALVERLTAHDSTPDALFVSTVYLTFRLFAKPADFVAALVWRFRYAGDSQRLAGPVRLRVYNALKGWLETHWRHDCDDSALPAIIAFAREDVAPVLPTASKRLVELSDIVASTHAPALPRVQSAMGRTSTSTSSYINPATPMPNPVISKSQLTALRTWKMGGAGVTILDFDPLELARQITLKTSGLFCSILPEELLANEWMKTSNSLAVNVRALSRLSTDISNLVSESVLQLEDVKKRATIIKQWIKIANKCAELNNYESLFAIVAALNSTNITRMLKTWDQVSQKTKNTLEELRKITNFERNFSAFRDRLQNLVPPCIPYVGMYLTDLTFVDHGNAATRQLNAANGPIEVINLDKHMRTAKLISDLQRFQIPYRFQEVSELQTWMQDRLIQVRSNDEKNYQNHYRRSLVLEPREQMPKASPNPEAGSARDKFDLLAWTHLSGLNKNKSGPAVVTAQ
ncbi:Ras guanine nucleotide exchange factor A [Cyphellophora attinorum]|uniref:Ras guanine nucleotide exchange factor A n=1 Tax=Cyphellophora attinorum TaxID=1664694 RepID=A0A0N0NRZ1_9EURO|nr:Ras guanine nucleotide exchange factor A [Phialophora attinorum]KPI45651.1 Ras guanine nucleotide exchange factor A [Phialophora attinorum]